MGGLQQTGQSGVCGTRQDTFEQALFGAPDAVFAQGHGQGAACVHRIFHALQGADVFGNRPVHQHLGFTFGLQAVEHTLHPQRLAAQHGFGQLKNVVPRHVEHSGFDLLLHQLTGRVQQREFLDFLVGGEQVAFDPVGKKLQRALAHIPGCHTLALLHPAGELAWEQVEAAVLNVARYDVFKLSEAVLSGQVARTQRMLDGLQAEGEAEVLVHWALAEDIRALKRVKDAMNAGKPLPMALRENRVWGVKERLYQRLLPQASDAQLARLLQSAHVVDGIVKGLKQADWPQDGWQALSRLALQLCRLGR